MLEPDEWQTRETVLAAFENDISQFEVVLALAKVGWAFCQIQVFEDHVQSLLLSASNLKIGKRSQYEALEAGAEFLIRHEKLSKAALGQMVGYLKQAGIRDRDATYLERLVSIRNDFVHRFSHQVPLPGEWEKYDYTAEAFASYPQNVGRRFEHATNNFYRIMVASGWLRASYVGGGRLLHEADSLFAGLDE